jgi:cholesterol transport system auxiliary component
VLLACALSGCSSIGSLITKTPPPAYDLVAARHFPPHGGLGGQISIAEPTALSALDGDRIVVRPSPGQAAALGGAQWDDRLPKLVQARLLQSFENARLMRRVGRPADRIATDFTLISSLRAFDISVADRSAVIEIAVKIVSVHTGRIVTARVFHVAVPAESTDGPAAVAALNVAFAKVEREIVLWVTRAV